MPEYLSIGAGGGGAGGLTLGPPTNAFTGANKNAAETSRDTYATANPAWLAQYDDEPTFTITITHGTTTLYQARRGSSWADVTGLIRGQRGLTGFQARFLVYAYINATDALKPTTAPASSTFVQSTGTLTAPTGYTVIPVTPAIGANTYRTEAVVNPATDDDSVALDWGLASLLPAYCCCSSGGRRGGSSNKCRVYGRVL